MSSTKPAARGLTQRHPLQKLSSPSRGVSAVTHVLGLASFANTFTFLLDNPNKINQAWGWHFQYLTIIGLGLAAVTFTFGLLADITLSKPVFQIKNALAVAITPLEVLISILYWSIVSIDKSLVVPPDLPALPISTDIGFHAIPALLLAFDVLFLSPPWAISVPMALGLSGSIAVAYWVWVEACFAHNGFYPYPIFDISMPLRVGLFAIAAVVMTFSTVCLDALYRAVNGKPLIKQEGVRPGKRH